MYDAVVADITGMVRVSMVTDNDRVFVLQGECKRCGRCCQDIGCKSLGQESVDGQIMAMCQVYHNRPWGCALYPRDPSDPLHEGCGFHWEEIP